MEMQSHLPRVYERTPDFEAKAEEIRLSFLEWKIVFALDGCKSVADLAGEFRLTDSRANEIFERLIASAIATECQISLAEYRERIKSRPAEPTLVRPERAEQYPVAPRLQQPASPLAETPAPEPGMLAARIGPSLAPRPAASETPASAPTESRSDSVAASTTRSPRGAINFSLKKRFKLKSAIDFIHGHAGGGTLGELAVYRVFMQVPGDLLRETGLRKMDFNDDTIEIDNPKLRQAIVDAISKTLRVPLPVSYFLQ